MKIAKRFLAVLLSVVMLLTLVPFGTVFADETEVTLTDIEENTAVGKAVTELVKLGIINGYEDGTFRADNTITRGEVAKIIITFLGQEEVAYDSIPSGFADVDDAGHWAKKYIKLAADQKIVNGYEDGTFRADNPVKYTEIVKMLVCTLGYGKIAEDRTSAGSAWYSGYMALAAEKSILAGASVNNVEDNASRGIVSILVYNCLEVEIAHTNSDGEVIINSDSNALNDFQGKEEITGIVTGVQQTGLETATTGLSSREISVLIGNEEKVYQVSSGYDTMSILGHRITGYVEGPDDNGDFKITQISNNRTEVVTVTPEQIDDVTSGKLTYYPSASSSKASAVSFDNNMTVIYNGKYDSTFDVEEFLEVSSGNIRFISNDGDKDAEVAIVTAYETFVVNSVDKNAEPPKVYSKYNAGELEIPYDARNINFSLTKTGSNADPEALVKSLKEWDVINVVRSKEDAPGKAVWNGIITSKKVSGVVQESESATRKKIGGKFYDFSESYKNFSGAKPEMALNDYVTIYLDHEGKIAAASASSTQTNINLAYLMTAAKQPGVNGVTQVSLYGITGTTKQRTLNLASTVRIDGRSYSTSATSPEESPLAILGAASLVANEGKEAAGVAGATAYSQLIRYTTNSKNEVDMIDTIAVNASVSEDDLVLSSSYPNSVENPTLKYTSGGRFENASGSLVFTVNSSTKVLELAYDDFMNLEKIYIRSYSAAFTDGASYRVDAFNMSETKAAKYVISYVGGDYGTASINDRSPMMISTNVSTIREGDENIDKASGYTFPGAVEMMDDDALTSESEGILKNEVGLGDLFRYALSNNKVVEVQKILDNGNHKPAIINPATGDDITAAISESDASDAAEAADLAKELRSFMIDDVERTESTTFGRFVFGTVMGIDLSKKEIMLTPTTKDDAFGIQEAHEETFEVGSAKVFLYDYTASKDANKVIADTQLDNIRSYKTLLDSEADTSNASQVLIYYTGAYQVKAIIIFKY